MTPAGTAADRAVVQIQLATPDGAPAGDWETLVPHRNVHDKWPLSTYMNCMFDPTDDGNTEEDFFDPADPARRLGPSSTCLPARVFANLGDTEGPFAPGDIGSASDGPGLEGDTGPGTWVESKFDLQRFRGRLVRLRFLVSSTKLGARHPEDPEWKEPELTWGDAFVNDWGAWDDGWFIDSVAVSDTLASPATLIPDTKDNGALLDGDDDGWTCDCLPDDASFWALPGDVTGLALSHTGGVPGTTVLSWYPPEAVGGLNLWYDTLRSTRSDDFLTPAVCVESDDGSDASAIDAAAPEAGDVYYYLVRAENGCTGVGGLVGTNAAGQRRIATSCP